MKNEALLGPQHPKICQGDAPTTNKNKMQALDWDNHPMVNEMFTNLSLIPSLPYGALRTSKSDS